MGITATNVFQHAASDVYPLGTAMASYYTPPRQGTTQQALWALHYSFNRNVRDLIVSYLFLNYLRALFFRS